MVMSVEDVHAPFAPGGASTNASSHAVPSCTIPWNERRALTQNPSEQCAGLSMPLLIADHVTVPSMIVGPCPLGGVVDDVPATMHWYHWSYWLAGQFVLGG
jgi:hypothetical protein